MANHKATNPNQLPYFNTELNNAIIRWRQTNGYKDNFAEMSDNLLKWLNQQDPHTGSEFEQIISRLYHNSVPKAIPEILLKEGLGYPDVEGAEKAMHEFLRCIGQNPDREGLKDTPKRYVKFMLEFLNPDKFNYTTFTGEGYDGMVVSANIPFFSLCEHHLAPFFGHAHIAYIPGPDKKIVGISKLPRTLETFARQLQNQERITKQVAATLSEELNTSDVGVIITARHLCQEMRGVKKHGVNTTTSEMLGAFKKPETRNEFISFTKQ